MFQKWIYLLILNLFYQKNLIVKSLDAEYFRHSAYWRQRTRCGTGNGWQRSFESLLVYSRKLNQRHTKIFSSLERPCHGFTRCLEISTCLWHYLSLAYLTCFSLSYWLNRIYVLPMAITLVPKLTHLQFRNDHRKR